MEFNAVHARKSVHCVKLNEKLEYSACARMMVVGSNDERNENRYSPHRMTTEQQHFVALEYDHYHLNLKCFAYINRKLCDRLGPF
jgi:hypothetical protein